MRGADWNSATAQVPTAAIFALYLVSKSRCWARHNEFPGLILYQQGLGAIVAEVKLPAVSLDRGRDGHGDSGLVGAHALRHQVPTPAWLPPELVPAFTGSDDLRRLLAGAHVQVLHTSLRTSDREHVRRHLVDGH